MNAGCETLLVGHCVPDSFAIRSALERFAPGAESVRVDTEADLGTHDNAAVPLVNRMLDGDFATESGLALIASLDMGVRAQAALISDLADAQSVAEKLGAVPGFGKSGMHGERARACIAGMVGGGGWVAESVGRWRWGRGGVLSPAHSRRRQERG